MAEAAPVGVVDAGLATEGHALLENGFVAFGDPGGFVSVEADAVSGAMFEEFFEARFTNLVEAFLVDLFCDGAFFQMSNKRLA